MKTLIILSILVLVFIAGCTQTGQITAEVKLKYICPDGTTVDNPNTCPAQRTIQSTNTYKDVLSASMEIKDARFSWYDYGYAIDGKFGSGRISSIRTTIKNNGTVIIKPVFDVTVSRLKYGVVCSETVATSFISSIEPSESSSVTIFIDCDIDSRGTYEINLELKDEDNPNLVIAQDYEYKTASEDS